MYVNGMGFPGIEWVTKVHHTTIIHWVKLAATTLSDAPPAEEIPEAQLDELETFVGKKN